MMPCLDRSTHTEQNARTPYALQTVTSAIQYNDTQHHTILALHEYMNHSTNESNGLQHACGAVLFLQRCCGEGWSSSPCSQQDQRSENNDVISNHEMANHGASTKHVTRKAAYKTSHHHPTQQSRCMHMYHIP
mmetsp:Transcript_15647/g.43231  ORF Transcript_15647/g.43231 Transcript_15647/m.43231 type:complete len:133 (+) Transcript_15647:1254-1652(+)